MRVFGTSGIVDIPSECLYICTISMPGRMDR